MHTSKENKMNNKGFSLAEIMIVLVIIGGIMALILPKIMTAQAEAKVRETKIKLSEIDTKIGQYEADCNGKFPTSLEFMIKDTDCKNWTSSKHSQNLMKDSWNNEFVFEPSDKGYNLKSYGADKKEGGEGPDKDIYSQGSADNQE